jgi:hypothetical protein
MHELTSDGRRRIAELAGRYGISAEAAAIVLRALIAGGGTMAQFNHPELGGMGQWSQGGMIMVGDMFNDALKAKVSGFCTELAGLVADQSNWQQRGEDYRSSSQPANRQGGDIFSEVSLSIPAKGANFARWWGADLGHPASTGAQNATRYAYFPASRRLALEVNGRVTFYDTGDHQIGGVSQQQSGEASLTFTSQHGTVRIADLPVIPAAEAPVTEFQPPLAEADEEAAQPVRVAQKSGLATEAEQPSDIIMLIERLAGLREKNILSEEEFSAKKAELLARL